MTHTKMALHIIISYNTATHYIIKARILYTLPRRRTGAAYNIIMLYNDITI